MKTRVRAHERQNPHGGTEHVREHYREVPGSSPNTRNETNFEDEDQIEEELDKNRGFEDEREALRKRKKEMKQQIIAKGLELRNESLTNPQIADELRSLFPEADFITPEWVRRNVPSKGARDKN